jgi:NAD(P)-dependent dehydrogenase (short-subunit alcohol dehydrogenase family)
MSEFKDKTVVILNASSGIGLSVANAFLSQGAKVIAVENQAGLDAVRSALNGAHGGQYHCIEAGADCSVLFDRCEKQVGPVDILICAAPPIDNVKVLDMSATSLRAIVEGELVSPALLMQEAARRMAARGQGRIIVFFSMSAKTGVHTNTAPFAAAKGGLLAYARVMAAELAPHGVTVNSIATSLFEPQVVNMEKTEREALAKAIPVRRFGRPAEAAHAAVFLASNDAAFITGETMNMSGGRFMD